MRDITYCTSPDCPSKDCAVRLIHNKDKFKPGDMVSMADFSGTCRYYIGSVLCEIEENEKGN